MEIWTLTCAF